MNYNDKLLLLLPDPLIRIGIRRLCKQRLRDQTLAENQTQGNNKLNFIQSLKESPIALNPDSANEQHYELPAKFFELVLGKHLKYSCCYWDETTIELTQAEEKMLKLYLERARLEDGQKILELGAGWGSLALYIAEKFPNSTIITLTNSEIQKTKIEKSQKQKALTNLSVIHGDINDFESSEQFDRVLSIEMFEHMRNFKKLLEKIHGWLQPDGFLFVHHFCHKHFLYPYETDEKNSWMAKHFFTGGIMPSEDLLLFFQEKFHFVQRWRVNGTHYQQTCEAWLDHLQNNKQPIMELFAEHYPSDQVKLHYRYWEIFFMACSELFGFRQGEEWFVTHYLLRRNNDVVN